VAAALGYLLVVAVMLVARGDEALVAPPYVVGALVVLGGGFAIAVTSPGSEAIWMAACFALGQVATVLALARLAARSVPELASFLVRSAAAACALALLPGVAYRVGATAALAGLMALAGGAVLVSLLREIAVLRARR
jgi:hypothetical protein